MRLSSKDSEMGLAGSEPFIRGVAAFLVLAGLGLAIIRFLGGSAAEDGLEGALGAFALGAPVMATGALASTRRAAAVAARATSSPASRR